MRLKRFMMRCLRNPSYQTLSFLCYLRCKRSVGKIKCIHENEKNVNFQSYITRFNTIEYNFLYHLAHFSLARIFDVIDSMTAYDDTSPTLAASCHTNTCARITYTYAFVDTTLVRSIFLESDCTMRSPTLFSRQIACDRHTDYGLHASNISIYNIS